MNSVKEGCKLFGIKPEMVFCDNIIQSVFNAHGWDCDRTSIVGRKHSDKSLHPVGYAVDYRTKHIDDNDTKIAIASAIRICLPLCDVILEDLDGAQEHIHVEFDPKDDAEFQDLKAAYKRGEIDGW